MLNAGVIDDLLFFLNNFLLKYWFSPTNYPTNILQFSAILKIKPVWNKFLFTYIIYIALI